ncbi:5-formyltetrahydrofolate cyclo-ligase [Gilbertella persicaria]|nr:5-formyltetrahydrofolate cyclo-ligase [Gilbertella persicaria]KAI8076526.1 5-formyltetrahydrofolate cyclo-ligase [Gilbertella persicaria]
MNKTVVTLKRQLRKDMAARLEKVTTLDLQKQSDLVFERLQQLDQFKHTKNISIYISMPTCEIMTKNMIYHILESDKNCFIPRCTKDTMEMVKINSIQDFDSLPINKWNIPEPPLDQPRENALDSSGLDLILVPGVAFDQNRNRIGHGKGYYDRYIKRCKVWAKEHGVSPPKTGNVLDTCKCT